MLATIISLASGAAGGNIAGSLFKNLSLGTAGNSIAGILGGGLGAGVLGMMGMGGVAEPGGGVDIGSIVGSLASGGVGGGIVMAVIGAIKNAMGR